MIGERRDIRKPSLDQGRVDDRDVLVAVNIAEKDRPRNDGRGLRAHTAVADSRFIDIESDRVSLTCSCNGESIRVSVALAEEHRSHGDVGESFRPDCFSGDGIDLHELAEFQSIHACLGIFLSGRGRMGRLVNKAEIQIQFLGRNIEFFGSDRLIAVL